MRRMDGRNGGFRGLPNPEGDIMSYNVYRNGNLVPSKTVSQTVSGDSVCLDDLALTNSKEYVYQVEAVDARGNRSVLSGKLSVTPSGGMEWGP